MKKIEWEKTVLNKFLSNRKERKTKFKSSSFPTERIYSLEDLAGINFEKEIGFPGSYPYTRGIQPIMYRGKLWTMRQYAGFGSAEESNKRYRYLLKQGQTGLSVAFDLPTQIGYDSDNELSLGEVGKVGVAIDTLKDMEILFNEIPLDQVSVSMTINATAAIIFAMYLALAERRGIPYSSISGTIQNDILKEYIARGTYIYPPKQSLHIISDIFSFCSRHTPRWNTISISGYHIREAGATAAQELAFTFANAIEYLRSAIKSGLHVNDFAPRLSFFFSFYNDFFEEIAKFRAARKIWATIMKEKFKASGKSLLMRFHTQTGGVTLTAQQAMNNIVRVTLQAMAAVLGGTQSLHTNSMDEAHALPSEEAVRVALRTQQIIAHESGVADTIDPLGGSYFVETLTQKMAEEVFEYLNEIDKMGGVMEAINAGYIQKQIQNSSYQYQKEIDNQEQIIVGVNEYQDRENISKFKLHRVSKKSEEQQIRRLHRIKRNRNHPALTKNLRAIRKAAENQENLIPPIIEAVKEYATIQEISDELRTVFGEYQEKIII